MATAPPLGGGIRTANAPGGRELFLNDVAPSYFSVMRIPIVRGRTFLPSDQDVAIVSESAARALWPNEDAIGKICGFLKRKRTVVGVVGDTVANGVDGEAELEVYMPLDGENLRAANLIVHTNSDPARLLAAVRSAVATPGAASSAWLMLTRMNERVVTRSRCYFRPPVGGGSVPPGRGGVVFCCFWFFRATAREGGWPRLEAGAGDFLGPILCFAPPPGWVGVAGGLLLRWASKVKKNLFAEFSTVFPVSYATGVWFFLWLGLLGGGVRPPGPRPISLSAALRSE